MAFLLHPEFWQRQKVLLTGHTGFKGSWLGLWLHLLGAEVFGFALPPEGKPNLCEQLSLERFIHHQIGNITNFKQIQQTVSQCQPDIVIHMAAQALVRRSYQDPLKTYQTNVMGTVNLLEAIRQCGYPCVIINVTSDKCYQNLGNQLEGFRETDPLGGIDPYSSSKACAELVANTYLQTYFAPANFSQHHVALASVRAGNVIGGGDWAEDRLIPDIIRAKLNQAVLTIRYPQSIRPWQHVLDPLHGYLALAEKLSHQPEQFNGAWNLGPAAVHPTSVADILATVSHLWPPAIVWQSISGQQPYEATTLQLNPHKAQQQLQWNSQLDVKTAVAWTIDWYQAYQQGRDMMDFTQHQIQTFMKSGTHA